MLLTLLLPAAPRAQTVDFSGDWQTYWRTDSAVLSLSQDGDRVTGRYEPGDGTVEGTVEGRLLTARWAQPGASGTVVFALSEDGQVLTGRFGNGEYWNGFRDESDIGRGRLRINNATPRETLRSLLVATNIAVYEGNARALRRIDALVSYAGPRASAGEEARRRTLMFDILDMSTFRIMDVPVEPEDEADVAEGGVVRFEIGPVAITEQTVLEFRQTAGGRWRLVLPEEEQLLAERNRLLTALGYTDMAELNRARADSPRHVLREFILGAKTWDEGGRERALAVLDLSQIPERLHDLEGPIYADFLRRILARIGFVIWQEIPDNPRRSVPYLYYQHPVGNVTIARVAEPRGDGGTAEGPPPERWKLAAQTLAAAPVLLEAMQDLPTVRELTEPEPLSSFFRLRERVRATAPALIADLGYLERWQWIGFAATFVAALIAVWVIGLLMRALARIGLSPVALAALAFPTGLMAAGIIINWAISRLGVTQAGLPLVGALASTFLVLTIGFFAYRCATLIGGWFLASAQKTTSYVDEIAASLGTGLLKLLIVIAAIIAVADVVGLPYEGVLTGLGVGGVAIAFAARDTVSNMIGGGLLIADRPFQRGDLIELDGTLATVEEVGLRSTKLRTLDDTLLHVPNTQLSDRKIANWGKRRRRKCTMTVGLTYDTPRETLDAFVQRLHEVVRAQQAVDPDDIYVGLSNFGASSIDIALLCHFRVSSYAEQIEAQHKLMIEIIALAEELEAEFAFPTRTVHLAGPSEPDALTQVSAS
ncbi:MAG: mechanosensitive ion channel family protein [Pikeienuella sp.]